MRERKFDDIGIDDVDYDPKQGEYVAFSIILSSVPVPVRSMKSNSKSALDSFNGCTLITLLDMTRKIWLKKNMLTTVPSQ